MFWNFTPGGTSSSKAQNPPFLQATTLTTTLGTNLRLQDGLPPPPGVDPNRAPAGTTRSIFDINARDAYAHNYNVNVQRQLGTNYLVEVAYAGSQGRQLTLKGDPNQARPTVGVTNSDVNRPYIAISPALRTLGRVQSEGRDQLQRAAHEVQPPARESVFVRELLYVREDDGLQLRQRRHRHAPQRLRLRTTTGRAPNTTSGTPSARTGSTSCRSRATSGMAAGT